MRPVCLTQGVIQVLRHSAIRAATSHDLRPNVAASGSREKYANQSSLDTIRPHLPVRPRLLIQSGSGEPLLRRV
jgi:hypothetical protein